MSAIGLVVAAWLFAAPPAQAQRMVGRSLSAAPVPRMPVGRFTTASGGGTSSPYGSVAPAPQLSVAPMLGSMMLAVPVAVRLSAVNEAVAQFARVDLRAASAPEARGAADALMARVLTEDVERREESEPYGSVAFAAADVPLSAPTGPAPRRAPVSVSRVHLLSRPLHETAELGPVARALHYILEMGFQFGKAALAWQATGSVTAGLAVLAFSLPQVPPMITAQSLADLGLRYWWRKLATLRGLARAPGVTRIRVLTTGETEFSGILARRQENTGLVFVDADGSLPETIAGFGAPIPVADLAERRVRLILSHDGVSDAVVWTPTLAELLSGRPIPSRVAAAWRARLEADKQDKTRFKRLFDFSKEKELRVEAHLSDGAGGETALGTIVFGRSVKRLVGLGRRDLIGALFGRAPAARAIPLSDTIVERGSVAEPYGAARAWRRLTGRLIARP